MHINCGVDVMAVEAWKSDYIPKLSDRTWRDRSTSTTLDSSALLASGHSVRILDIQIFRSNPWIHSVREALEKLMNLGPNWDSYGGETIAYENVQCALHLLSDIMNDDSPPPDIVPTSSGGLQIEWHTTRVDFEIEVSTPSAVSAFFENETNKWEIEHVVDLSRLREAIKEVSS